MASLAGQAESEAEGEVEEREVEEYRQARSAASTSGATRLLTGSAAAAGSVLATCCCMGPTASSLANRGCDLGLQVGVFAGAVTGNISASAVSRALAFQSARERTDFQVITRIVTGGPVAMILGGSCAVLGGVAGGVAGAVEDLRADLAGAVKQTFMGMAANVVKPAVSIAMGLSFNLQDGPRKVAQLPQEALPFLGALIGARRAGVLTEEDAFGRAAGFAARCALEVPGSEVPREAEQQSRLVRLLMQLQACYPWEEKEGLEQVASRLLEELEPEALDAAWQAFGPSSLQQWAYDNRGLLPRCSIDMSGDLLLRALDMRYEEERNNMVRVLHESFPGGDGQDYHRMLQALHDALPQAAFWKGYRLLQSGCLPRLPFASVQSPEALERVCAYLASSPSPDLPLDSDSIATDLSGSTGSRGLSPCAGTSSPGRDSLPDLPPLQGSSSPVSFFMTRPATLAPPPALIKAVEQAQSSLATADAVPQNSEHGGLWLEVLRVTGLGSADTSRVANAAAWLLGSRSQHPYVRAALGRAGIARQGLLAGSQQTRAVAADREGCADFGEAVSFPLGASDVLGTTLELLEVRFQVLDRRPLFGDASIGEGSLRLTDKMLGAFEVHKVELSREGVSQGSLLVRAGVLTPPSALGILERSSKEPLAVVMKAFAQLLAQPCCVALLMESRPKELLQKKLVEEAMVHKMLQSWVVTFCACASHLRNGAKEDETIGRLVCMARSARGIAAECAGLPEDSRDVEDLLVEWLHGFCARCAGTESSIELDEARLARVLEGSRVQCKRLEDLGVNLPAQLPAALAAEVHTRLLEAEACEEREIFTGVRIVRNGQVPPGLAAVILPQHGGQRRPIFFYSHFAIREWQRQHKNDPCTREALSKKDIWPLTA